MSKTPFAIDPHPLAGACSARAGLSAVSRVFRSLNLPGVCEANLGGLKARKRGLEAGAMIESLLLLHAAGGDCMDDMDRLGEDQGLSRMLGYPLPASRSVRDFLERFHDPARVGEAERRAQGQQQLAFIPEPTEALEGLARLLTASARNAARAMGPWTIATVDEDATLIESHKRTAKTTYEGYRGYQPMLSVWAETGLVLADEFRDGNVPARMAPLRCAQAAFAALPPGITRRYFRGDSACYEWELLDWLRQPARAAEPGGPIGFAISAPLSQELARVVKAVGAKRWKTLEKEVDGTLRQWAELDFVPTEPYENKERQPLRYIGIRLLKPQGELFADGNDRQHFAIVTNRPEEGGWIVNWQRQKAGSVEQTHDQLKNGLGAAHMPSQKFGANAAWFRIACVAYNVILALRANWPQERLHTAHMKRLRFAIFQVTGRVVRDRRKISLRLSASRDWIKQFIQLFEAFPLLTRPTG
jgi:hypothetical protein